MSEYSGPSGWLGSGGDIGFVDYFRKTDLVITPMGAADGSADQLKVNMDLYTVRRLADGTTFPVIIDLGTVNVPNRTSP